MQQTVDSTTMPRATIISLAERRARRRARPPRATAVSIRLLVGIGLGAAAFATLALVGVAATIALARPEIGVPAGIALSTVASWRLSGLWLARRVRGGGGTPPAGQHPARRGRHGAGSAGITS